MTIKYINRKEKIFLSVLISITEWKKYYLYIYATCIPVLFSDTFFSSDAGEEDVRGLKLRKIPFKSPFKILNIASLDNNFTANNPIKSTRKSGSPKSKTVKKVRNTTKGSSDTTIKSTPPSVFSKPDDTPNLGVSVSPGMFKPPSTPKVKMSTPLATSTPARGSCEEEENITNPTVPKFFPSASSKMLRARRGKIDGLEEESSSISCVEIYKDQEISSRTILKSKQSFVASGSNDEEASDYGRTGEDEHPFFHIKQRFSSSHSTNTINPNGAVKSTTYPGNWTRNTNTINPDGAIMPISYPATKLSESKCSNSVNHDSFDNFKTPIGVPIRKKARKKIITPSKVKEKASIKRSVLRKPVIREKEKMNTQTILPEDTTSDAGLTQGDKDDQVQ